VGFVIADSFSVCDLSVCWDVCQANEETCIASWNVSNSVEQASEFVAKTSRPKWS
jgi:hypothetical protein